MNVCNITCTFSVGCRVKHADLINKLVNFERKKNFMIIRIRQPRATANLFESGAITMSGLTSVVDVRRAARVFARKIQKAGYPTVTVKNLVIQNVVFSMSVPYRLNLALLPSVLENRVKFEPELNPGATVYGEGSKRYIYYHTGSIVVTGYKDIKEGLDHYACIVDIAETIKK